VEPSTTAEVATTTTTPIDATFPIPDWDGNHHTYDRPEDNKADDYYHRRDGNRNEGGDVNAHHRYCSNGEGPEDDREMATTPVGNHNFNVNGREWILLTCCQQLPDSRRHAHIITIGHVVDRLLFPLTHDVADGVTFLRGPG
jgi:hypothetical protein